MKRDIATEEAVNILYEIDQLPVLQNRMYDAEAESKNCPRGDIRLVESLTTGLVYNECFRPDSIQYDDHYQNEQAVSEIFRRHLATVMQIIADTIGRKSIVEVGCGKGFFLEMLSAAGFDVWGFDPAYEGTNARVVKQYYSPELGMQADGVVLRHVLEHIKDPVAFLMQLRDANDGVGKVYIEVPCFDWICEHRAWFDIFYEHVNYFRVSDFHRMFDVVHDSGHLFGDQYIYVVAELSSLKNPKFVEDDRPRFPKPFMRDLTEYRELDERGEIIVWGGASKGVIFSLLVQRGGLNIRMVVDINPAKQGKYLAGSGLRVDAPEKVLPLLQDGTTICVMNSNYLHEIQTMAGKRFNYVSVDHG